MNIFRLRNVLISLGVFIGLYIIINFSPIGLAGLHTITDGVTILDMELEGYSVDRAYEVLEGLGEEGRTFALHKIMPQDFLFPLSYGVFYFMVLTYLASRIWSNLKKPWIIGCIGFIPMVFDWLENVMIFKLITNYPERLIGTAEAANAFTKLKSSLMTVTMAVILLFLILSFITRRKRSGKTVKSA